jgi:hypothetical protein
MNAPGLESKWDFFIAHAGHDKAIAEQLYDQLKGRSRPFLDVRCILPGDPWPETLRDAQDASLITVALISSHTDRAFYQGEEIATAIALSREAGRHRVVPVYLNAADGQPLPAVYGLRGLHHVTLSESFAIPKLADTLIQLLTTTVQQPGGAAIPDERETAPPGARPEAAIEPGSAARDVTRLIDTAEACIASEADLVALILKFAPGPALSTTVITQGLVSAFVRVHGEAVPTLQKAARLRVLADPRLPEDSIVPGVKPISSAIPRSFWWEVLLDACAYGPRMLIALLLSAPPYALTAVIDDVELLASAAYATGRRPS